MDHGLWCDPVFVDHQQKRCDHVGVVIANLQRIRKKISHYAETGRNLCGSLHEIIKELEGIDYEDIDGIRTECRTAMEAIEAGFGAHFREVETTSDWLVENLLKRDIEVMNTYRRQYMRAESHANVSQEKVLSLSKKAPERKAQRKARKLSDAENSVSKALNTFVRSVGRSERGVNGVVEQIMVAFAHSFTKYAKQIKDVPVIRQEEAELVVGPASAPAGGRMLSLAEIGSCGPPLDDDIMLRKQGFLWRKRKFAWDKVFAVCSDGNLSCSSRSPDATLIRPERSVQLAFCRVEEAPKELRLNCFTVTSESSVYTFQAPSEQTMKEWINVIRGGISSGLLGEPGGYTQRIPSMSRSYECADCGTTKASWMIAHKFMTVCVTCAGVHRGIYGSSCVKSRMLDVIDRHTLKVVDILEGTALNAYLEYGLEERLINADSSNEDRAAFIKSKYVEKAFCERKRHVDPFEALERCDLLGLLIAIEEGKIEEEMPGKFTLMHAAACVGDPLLITIIARNSKRQINALDEGGWSPIAYAVFHGNVKACEALVEFDADIFASKVAHPYLIARQRQSEELQHMFQKFLQSDPTRIADAQEEFVPPNVSFSAQVVRPEHIPPVLPPSPGPRETTELHEAIKTMNTRRLSTLTVRHKPL